MLAGSTWIEARSLLGRKPASLNFVQAVGKLLLTTDTSECFAMKSRFCGGLVIVTVLDPLQTRTPMSPSPSTTPRTNDAQNTAAQRRLGRHKKRCIIHRARKAASQVSSMLAAVPRPVLACLRRTRVQCLYPKICADRTFPSCLRWHMMPQLLVGLTLLPVLVCHHKAYLLLPPSGGSSSIIACMTWRDQLPYTSFPCCYVFLCFSSVLRWCSLRITRRADGAGLRAHSTSYEYERFLHGA